MSRLSAPLRIAILLLIIPATSSDADHIPVVHPSMVGYAYQVHSAGPDLWSVGNVFTVVAVAEPGDLAIIPLDEVTNEYTVVLENVVIRNYSESGAFGFVEFETGMVFSAFEDPRATGTAADFGITPPPNPTVPSTFTDGTRIAFSGTRSGEFYLRMYLPSGNGFFVWGEGLPIKNCALLGPGFHEWLMIQGWVALPGADADPPLEMPGPGYAFRLIAESDCDSPLQPGISTWGQVKAHYR